MSIITSNSHTAPTPIFTSMYTILALAFISISILGVFCYSVYRCYCSAVYQTRREWEIEQEQRLRERKSDEKGVRVLECEGRDLKANWTRCRSGTDCKTSFDSVTSVGFEFDITSPPLAVTYPHSATPRGASPVSPIFPLPQATEFHEYRLDSDDANNAKLGLSPAPAYTHFDSTIPLYGSNTNSSFNLSDVQTIPGPSPFYDSNSIPFYAPGTTLNPIDPKLRPVSGYYALGSARAGATSVYPYTNPNLKSSLSNLNPRSRTQIGNENHDPFGIAKLTPRSKSESKPKLEANAKAWNQKLERVVNPKGLLRDSNSDTRSQAHV